MFQFNPTPPATAKFHNPSDAQLRQAIAQATQSKAGTVWVSQKWFDRVKTTLLALGSASAGDAAYLPQWKLTVRVDPEITEELSFRVE